MSDPASQDQIDAASAYERVFVPAEFREWAPRMIAAAQLRPGHKVLDRKGPRKWRCLAPPRSLARLHDAHNRPIAVFIQSASV